MTPVFKGIDHVHLYVPNRDEAADWYRRVLGFSVVEKLRFWATPGGPLTMEDAGGRVHLAIFERPDTPTSSTIAFGADGESFLQWREHLESHDLEPSVSDHQVSWSLYFSDPYGNLHEISTFDHAQVSAALETEARSS